MVDSKTQWADFKKALRQTAMTWGFKQWFNTTVLGGPKWKEIQKLGVTAKDEDGDVVDDAAPEAVKPDEGDEADAPADAPENESKISSQVMKIMGYSESEVEYFQANTRFVNVLTGRVETQKDAIARQKLWHWMVKSLHGPRPAPGPYHYLLEEVAHSDVAALYQQLIRVIDTPTMVSQADDLAAVFQYTFNPQSQDIFNYYGEIKKLVRRVHDLNDRLPAECRILLPDTIVRALLLRAMRQVPLYKTVLDSVIIKNPDEWMTFSADELYKHLEQVNSNNRGVSIQPQPQLEGSVHANTVKVKGKTVSPCFSYRDSGVCSRKDCRFSHNKSESKSDAPYSSKPADSASAPASLCGKCGEKHATKFCKFAGKCSHCGILGHKEEVCMKKKAGKPKAMHLNADGITVVSNLCIVQVPSTSVAQIVHVADSAGGPSPLQALTMKADDGTLREQFFADTGANRHIYPNSQAAASFNRESISIGTAQGNNSMTSDGVGSMILYTPGGASVPGFDRVIFAKQASCKLASVGELCDANMVCVFNKNSLETYRADDVKIVGKPFTSDARDPQSRLYPLTLHRKSGEKASPSRALQVSVSCGGVPWNQFPETIPDDPSLTLLAKAYPKEGLSELDRFHAKLGDVGVKAMRRALPHLKIPDKYRCPCCIEGKIHKFEHRKCGDGERTEYEPGVCIDSDHSGPYTRSLGGHRYSQLFIDRGSGYLWAFRMAKKTGHYSAAPLVFADARAASGKRLQFFQTDGEGVFTSKITEDILKQHKVRHLWGAPHDSDTNPFVERARRTIFEGTSTSLLRSGAPSNFWGEAENHKVFTINVLPTFKDPSAPGVFLSRKNLLEGNKRQFNLERLMAFGTAATCYVPENMRKGGKHPAQRRFFRGVIVGYEDHTPAYRVWDLADRVIRVVSYNFTISHEGWYPFKDKDKVTWPAAPAQPDLFYPTIEASENPVQWSAFDFDDDDASEALTRVKTRSVTRRVAADIPDVPAVIAAPDVPADVPQPALLYDVSDSESDEKSSVVDEKSSEDELPGDEAPVRHSSRVIAAPSRLTYERKYIQSALAVEAAPVDKPMSIPPPKTLREAKLSPWWPQYKRGTEEEIAGLERNQTWDLVPISDVPKGKNIIRGKFVFDDKRGQDGKVIRFKARFVAMGFTQKPGVDYAETFAGVVISKTFRIMLVILNEDPTFEMQHWDVKLAFTKAPIEEELYMYQPEDFERNEGSSLSVCRLKKSLYGLKQSAHNWQQFVRNIFAELGFAVLQTDSCLYFLRRGDAWCLVATHVDDLFPLYNKPGVALRDSIFKQFQKYVEIDNLGPVSWALKTRIQRDSAKGILKISQEQFCKDFLSGVNLGAPVPIPAVVSGSDVNMTQDDVLDDEIRDYPFQSDIGSMWWLANISRPDIFFAVHRCAVWQNRPSRKLWRWLQQIKRYLAGAAHLGIVYQRSISSTLQLSGFVDGAFASEDEVKSRIGWFFLFHGNLVSWASENPKRILTSSTEVECRGLSQFAKENLWQRQLQLELGLDELKAPTTVYEDNTASIALSTNPGVPHKRSKHFGLEWAMFKEAVAQGEVALTYVSTEEQPADMMTKALPAKKFVYFRDRVMGGDILQNYFLPTVSTTSPGTLK